MALDIKAIEQAIAAHGPVARVTVAEVKGSAPRDVGASMLIWPCGQSGTIGGGALEYQAVAAGRSVLDQQGPQKARLSKIPLGPSLGQCCGGSVILLTEVMTGPEGAKIRAALQNQSHFARPVVGTSAEKPLPVQRILSRARATGQPVDAILTDGWFIEPTRQDDAPLWIFGAGHVGRALVTVFQTLPFAITWIDTREDRYPPDIPKGVSRLIGENPADLVSYAPKDTNFLVLTYSHALDLEICHRILNRDFASAGLIGSKTKWARFQKRLAALGHGDSQIARINCPIGRPEIGKAPEAIAIGVAADLLPSTQSRETTISSERDFARDYTS